MKRIFVLALVLFFPSSLFAKTGIGIQGGAKFTPSADADVGFNLRSEFSPWGIAASYNLKDKSIDLILDNWWIYKKINSRLNWFALWGMSFSGKVENKSFAEPNLATNLCLIYSYILIAVVVSYPSAS